MINPNGEDFTKNDPTPGSLKPGHEQTFPSGAPRFQSTSEKVSNAAGDAWRQTRDKAGIARERTEFFLRENPIPTILGALAVGLAIGLAIRYSSQPDEPEVKAKTPLGNVDLSVLSLPFLWPFFKTVKNRYEDTAEVVRDRVNDGVDRLRSVDVDDYVKPLRKKWRAWTR
ncbi:MAG: hypothetical protein M3Y86_04060 [Verrucomicrobiota bacterium]|nr:hypothetical protein [Verrucomicrobiota bacterium]